MFIEFLLNEFGQVTAFRKGWNPIAKTCNCVGKIRIPGVVICDGGVHPPVEENTYKITDEQYQLIQQKLSSGVLLTVDELLSQDLTTQ